MSFHRRVDIRMWGDEKFRKLSRPKPNAQTLWTYLLTGKHTGPVPGLFAIGRAALAEELEWPLRALDEKWKEIAAQGMACADWESKVVWLPNALGHNFPANEKTVKGWLQYLDGVPECELKHQALGAMWAALTARDEARAAAADASGKPVKDRLARPLEKRFGKPWLERLGKPYRIPYPVPLPKQEKEEEEEEEEEEEPSPPPPPLPRGEPAGPAQAADRSPQAAPQTDPEASAAPLTPAAVIELWRRVTGDEPPPGADEGKRLRNLKARLKDWPTEADWLPAIERARDLRDVLGAKVSWLTLGWLVAEPGNPGRLLAGEWDWALAQARERAGVRRPDPLREIWDAERPRPATSEAPEEDPAAEEERRDARRWLEQLEPNERLRIEREATGLAVKHFGSVHESCVDRLLVEMRREREAAGRPAREACS